MSEEKPLLTIAAIEEELERVRAELQKYGGIMNAYTEDIIYSLRDKRETLKERMRIINLLQELGLIEKEEK